MTRHEPWLRGPLPEISQFMTPDAHALSRSCEDVERRAAKLFGTRLPLMYHSRTDPTQHASEGRRMFYHEV
jgi:hypothetical protein